MRKSGAGARRRNCRARDASKVRGCGPHRHREYPNLCQPRQSLRREQDSAAIVAAADQLSVNPRLGRLGAMPGTFELITTSYVLVYEIHRAEIVVLRVWHGRQRRPGT
jgi:plasmid stabilization system protein ParE